MVKRSGKKAALKRSLNKGLEQAGKFLGKRNPGTLLAISGAVAGVVSLFEAGQADAATQYWDALAGDNSALDAGNGTWGGASASNFWNASITGVGSPGAWTSGSNAVFNNTTAGTNIITMGGNISAAGINFQGGTFNIGTVGDGFAITTTASIGGGNTSYGVINTNLIFGVNQDWTINSGGQIFVYGVISETGGARTFKTHSTTGGNAYFYNSANTYTGATTVDSGPLHVAVLADGGLASSIGKSSNAAANLVFSKGSGNGTTTLFIDGANATGSTTNRLFTITSGSTTLTTAKIQNDGSGAVNFTNTGAITMTGAFTHGLELAGSNTGANIFAPAISNPSGSITNFTKSGAGTWTISGANTYTGTTSITGGILRLGAAGALGDGTNNTSGVTVSSTGILDLNGISPTANVSLTMNSSASGFDVGALYNSKGSTVATYQGPVTLSANTRVGAGNITLTGAITGNGKNLMKDGVSNLELSNSGNVTLGSLLGNRGAVVVDSGTTLNVTGITFGSGSSVGSVLTMNGGSVISSGTAFFGTATSGTASGTVQLDGGTLTVPSLARGALAGASVSSNINFNGATLKANGNSGTFLTGFTNAKIQNGGAVIDDGGYAITIGQNLIPDTASTGGLTKLSTGTLTLTGSNNSYTGGTTISAGTLKAGAANALSANSAMTGSSTATLDVSGYANTVKSLNMMSGSTLKLGTGAVLTSSGNTALNGTIDISGSATLGKYQLINSTNAITGSFTQGSVPAQYTLLKLSANSLDLQHNAVAAMSLTPSVSRVMAGRTGVSFSGTLSNTAPVDSATLSVGTLSTAGQLTASGIGADLATLTAQGTAANVSGTFSAGTALGNKTLAVSNSTGGSASTNIDVFSPAQLLGSGSGYGAVGSATITKTGEPANYTLGNVAVADGDATKNQGFASFTVSPAAALVSPAYILIDLTGDQTHSTASLTSNLVAALTAAGLDATDVQSDFDGLLGKYQTLHTYDVAISYTPINSANFQFEYDFTQVSGFGSGTNYVTNVAAVPEPGSLGLLGMGALALMGSRRRKSKRVAGETALSRFYARRRIA